LFVVFAAAFVVLLAKLPPGPVAAGSPSQSVEPAATSPFVASGESSPALAVEPVPVAECPAATAAPSAEAGRPAGATDDFGIRIGCDGVPGGPQAAAPIRVDVVSDYICPYCQRLDEQVGAQFDQAVRDGQIELVLHPLGYLDVYSTTDYSSRAARAATAVAALDPEHFGAFDQALWDNQPAEGGPGLTDGEIAELARAAGVSEQAVAGLADGSLVDWVAQATELISAADGFQGTPWVLISQGELSYQWDWSDGDLQSAIAKVAAGQQP
jgi:protein-disulfide isomerase